MKKSRGFTLIELLVVIAIIGILAGIVLVNVNKARNKATDVAIKGDLSDLRTAAEMYYNDNSSSYASFTGSDCSTGSEDWQRICSHISSVNSAPTGYSETDTWCAQAALKEGGTWCADYKGASKSTTCTTAAPYYCQ